MGKVIAVTSGKGGVGKSTVSVCLSHALRRMNKSVLLIDMDCGFRCLDLMLGVSEQVVFDLKDVLCGRVAPAETIIPGKNGSADLIAAPFSPDSLSEEALSALAAEIAGNYDFVIFDFPAGLDTKLCRALPGSTLFLTVATPDRICIRDAAAVSRIISEFSCNRRLLINRFSKEAVASGLHVGIDFLIDQSYTQLLGVIPEDNSIAALSSGAAPKNSKTFRAFQRVSKRLCGEAIPLPKPGKL